jgi:hypothetical protein
MFRVFTVLCAIGLLSLPRKRLDESPDRDAARNHRVTTALRRRRLLLGLLTFGLVPLREWILDGMGIGLYGTFRRPPSWQPEPERADYVDRFFRVDNSGVEYQYARDATHLIVRSHSSTTDHYGSEQTRVPTSADVRLLLVGSNYFWRWYMRHLSKRVCRRAP